MRKCKHIFWRNDCFIRPNNCKQAIFLKDILGKLCFEWFPRAKKKFFGALHRAQNRVLPLDRIFWCSQSGKKIALLLQIVFFVARSRKKSCFRSYLFYVLCLCQNKCALHRVSWIFLAFFPRAKNFVLNRALWCSPSSKKIVPQIVLFVALLRARNRARMGPPR